MGPKKGKGKGGPVDGVDTTSMSREQLEAFSLRLKEELDREREERNFFQLERDKLRTFWEITRQQLEENRAQIRNQDRAQDENEEKHQSEMKTYKQKVKHLLYEHQCNLSNVKVERLVALKMAQDEYTAMENELLKDKNELKAKLREQELAHLEIIRQLKMEQSAEISKMREQISQDALELERKYEARLTTQNEEMGLQQSMELAEVEQRKNQQVVELTKSHEKAFNDMKNYYNEITLNNLALISSLKEQMEELKSSHERMEKQLREVQGENKRLTEPLKQAQVELTNLQRQLANYEHDKITLANTKQRLALVTKELEDLRWENEVLELRFERVEKERDRLHAEFVGAVLDVQQKAGLKSAMLGKKMADLRGGGAVSVDPKPRPRPRRCWRKHPQLRLRRARTPLADVTEHWVSPRMSRRRRQPTRHASAPPASSENVPPEPHANADHPPGRTGSPCPWMGVRPGGSWSELSSCSCVEPDAPRARSCVVLDAPRSRCSVCVLAGAPRCHCPPRPSSRRSLNTLQRSPSAPATSTRSAHSQPKTPKALPHRSSCTRRCKKCRRRGAGPGKDGGGATLSRKGSSKGLRKDSPARVSPKCSFVVGSGKASSTSMSGAAVVGTAMVGAALVGTAVVGAAVVVGAGRKRPSVARSTSTQAGVDAAVAAPRQCSAKRLRRSCTSSPLPSPTGSDVIDVDDDALRRARTSSPSPHRKPGARMHNTLGVAMTATRSVGTSTVSPTRHALSTKPPRSPRSGRLMPLRPTVRHVRPARGRQYYSTSPSRAPKSDKHPTPNKPPIKVPDKPPTRPPPTPASDRTSHLLRARMSLLSEPSSRRLEVKLSMAQISLPMVVTDGTSPRASCRDYVIEEDALVALPETDDDDDDEDIYHASSPSLKSVDGDAPPAQAPVPAVLPEVVITSTRGSVATEHSKSPRGSAQGSPWAKAPERETRLSIAESMATSTLTPRRPSVSPRQSPSKATPMPTLRRPSAFVSPTRASTASSSTRKIRLAESRRPSTAATVMSTIASTRRTRAAPSVLQFTDVSDVVIEGSVATLGPEASMETVYRGAPPAESTSVTSLTELQQTPPGMVTPAELLGPVGERYVRRSFAEMRLPSTTTSTEVAASPSARLALSAMQRSASHPGRPVTPRAGSRMTLDTLAPTATAIADALAGVEQQQQQGADPRAGGLSDVNEEASLEGAAASRTSSREQHRRRHPLGARTPPRDASTASKTAKTPEVARYLSLHSVVDPIAESVQSDASGVPLGDRQVCDASCEATLPSLFSTGPSERPEACDASCEAREPSFMSTGTSAFSVEADRHQVCDASCDARLPSLFSEGTGTSVLSVASARPQVCDAACEARPPSASPSAGAARPHSTCDTSCEAHLPSLFSGEASTLREWRPPSLTSAGTVRSLDESGAEVPRPPPPSLATEESAAPSAEDRLQKCDSACEVRGVPCSLSSQGTGVATEPPGVEVDMSSLGSGPTHGELPSEANTLTRPTGMPDPTPSVRLTRPTEMTLPGVSTGTDPTGAASEVTLTNTAVHPTAVAASEPVLEPSLEGEGPGLAASSTPAQRLSHVSLAASAGGRSASSVCLVAVESDEDIAPVSQAVKVTPAAPTPVEVTPAAPTAVEVTPTAPNSVEVTPAPPALVEITREAPISVSAPPATLAPQDEPRLQPISTAITPPSRTPSEELAVSTASMAVPQNTAEGSTVTLVPPDQPVQVASKITVGSATSRTVSACFSGTSSSEDGAEGKPADTKKTKLPHTPRNKEAAADPAAPRHKRRPHRDRGPRSKSLDDMKHARHRHHRGDSSPDHRADHRPSREGGVRVSAPQAQAAASSEQAKEPTASPKSQAQAKCSSRIKDWLRNIAHGRWASPARRLSVQTSTSDLSVADSAPGTRSSSASRRSSRKDLFKTYRHTGCCEAASGPSRRASSRPARRQEDPGESRKSHKSTRKARSAGREGRQGNQSVRFDVEDSSDNATADSSQLSDLSHLASTSEAVGRARSLPQLPRRGGLKRGARDHAERRARCRSEARVTGAPADEVLFTASAPGHRKTPVVDRHLQCYEDRTVLPPLPTRAWLRQRPAKTPTSSRSKSKERQKSGKAKRPREDAATHNSSSERSDSSASCGLPEKAVIWTKPGTAVPSSSVTGPMWLMFPSLLRTKATTRSGKANEKDAEKKSEPPRKEAAGAGASPREADPSTSCSSPPDASTGAIRKTVRRDESEASASRRNKTHRAAEDIELTTRRVERIEVAPASSRRVNVDRKTEPQGAAARKVSAGACAKGLSDSSTSSGSASPIPQVLSPPTPSPASMSHSWRALKDRVTIQEISSDDALYQDDDDGGGSGPSTPTVGVTPSRLSCLQEETDSDVKLANVSVASGPSNASFDVADPVELSRSQLHAWRAKEEMLVPDPAARHHRRGRREDDARPRRKPDSVGDDGERSSPRGRRWARSRSPKSSPGTPTHHPGRQGSSEDMPAGGRTPKVRFSTAASEVCSAAVTPNSSVATLTDLSSLKSAVEAQLLQQGQHRQSRSMTSMRPCPSASSQAAQQAPLVTPAPAVKPTRILVSRAKSTASLTGLHDVPKPLPAATSSDAIRLGKLLRPKEAMVVELFRKNSANDEYLNRSSSSSS